MYFYAAQYLYEIIIHDERIPFNQDLPYPRL